MIKQIIFAILSITLVFGPAWASPTSLPAGRYVKEGGDQLRAYTLEEFKIILHIYADYRTWYKEVPLLQEQVSKLDELVKNQNQQIQLADKNIKLLEGERDRLTKKWAEENKLRHECENKPAFGSWIAWSTAGAMGLVATVLTIILIEKD